MVDMIKLLVRGNSKDPDQRKHIYSEHMHIAMDNFFSGDEVLKYLGEGGRKGTMTCRCDSLPTFVPRKHINFTKAAPVNARSKVARFEKPIIAITYYHVFFLFDSCLHHNTQHQPTPAAVPISAD